MVLKRQNTSHSLTKFQRKALIGIHWQNPASDEERPHDVGTWLPSVVRLLLTICRELQDLRLEFQVHGCSCCSIQMVSNEIIIVKEFFAFKAHK